jgi:phospholipid/cholesterol/gamma-HCH transport system substrate-binding protein
LYNHLDEVACQLAKIMPRLDRVLKDAEVFADKIARHPELIGAGGAIRPSSGLKEAPTSVVPSTSFKPPH